MKLTAFVWANSKALVTLVLLLCGMGAFFATRLPVSIFPQLTVPRIAIAADAGDLPIETTLSQVTRPLEASVSTVPGVAKVASTTARGSNSMDVTFVDGTDMQVALQRVESQLADVRPTLPPATSVSAAVVNPSIFPIMGYSLTAAPGATGEDLQALRRLAQYTIRPQLARLPGVANIRITGGDLPEYLVAVHPEALRARGLSLQDVQDALAHANSVASIGQVERSYQRYDVLVSGLLKTTDNIRNVTIATHNRVPLTIGDVASVRPAVAIRTVLATGDGKPGVIINVIKQPDANTLQVAQAVHVALAHLASPLPKGVTLSRFYDQSEIVAQSESSVVESIVTGGALALIVLILFLGNLRAAGIVLILLPFSLLITFSLMKAMGQTLNIMTLGALAIALGLVIDDGIVVVENIYHQLEQGHTRREAIAAGMAAITPALMGSSITTMGAFFPLVLLGGVTGQFFAPLALVMIATLTVSLLLALFFGPLLATYLLPAKIAEPSPHRSVLERLAGIVPAAFDRLAALFGILLLFCLRHRLVVLLLMIPLCFGAYTLFNKLPTGFFPEFDEGAFVIDYRLPAGTSLGETDRVCHEVELILGKTPEVDAWSRLTGARSGSGLELAEQNTGDILVRLKPVRERDATEIMDDVRKQIAAQQPAIDTDFAQILQDGIGDIAGAPSPIEVKIYGPDTATLTTIANKAGEIVTATPGVVDVNNGVVESGPEMLIQVDSQRASLYGLTTDTILAAATGAMRGTVATTIQQGEASIDVRVKAESGAGGEGAQTLDTLPDIPLTSPASVTVPLRSVANLTLMPGTPQITRENQQQVVSVTARLEGRDLGSGVHDVQSRIAKQLTLPSGYRVEFGGLYASQQQSFQELALILLLAVLLVSTLLLVLLRSFRQAFTLLIAAVLSLSGVLLGLALTNTPLNISSFTGAIMVIGIVTEDGIVFFDVVNSLRREHPAQSLIELVLEARRLRLRPILMTILAAILALLPLALGLGAGAAMQKPLAIAVIGGLAASTLFTLIVAPVLFVSLERPPREKPENEAKALATLD